MGIIFFQLLLELNPFWLSFCCFRYNQARSTYFMRKWIMSKNKHRIKFLLFHFSLSGSGLRNKWKQGNGLLLSSGWKVRINQLSKSFYTASLELVGIFLSVFCCCCFNRGRSMRNTFVDLWMHCTSVLVGPRSVILRTSSNLHSVLSHLDAWRLASA